MIGQRLGELKSKSLLQVKEVVTRAGFGRSLPESGRGDIQAYPDGSTAEELASVDELGRLGELFHDSLR